MIARSVHTFTHSNEPSPQSAISRVPAPEDVAFQLAEAIREAEQDGTPRLTSLADAFVQHISVGRWKLQRGQPGMSFANIGFYFAAPDKDLSNTTLEPQQDANEHVVLVAQTHVLTRKTY